MERFYAQEQGSLQGAWGYAGRASPTHNLS